MAVKRRFLYAVLALCLCVMVAAIPVLAAATGGQEPVITNTTDKTAYTGDETIVQTVTVKNVTALDIRNVVITGNIPEGYTTEAAAEGAQTWSAEVIGQIAAGDTGTVKVSFTKTAGSTATGDNAAILFWTAAAILTAGTLFVLILRGKGKNVLAVFLAVAVVAGAFLTGPVQVHAAEDAQKPADSEVTVTVDGEPVTFKVYVEYEKEAQTLSYEGYTLKWQDEFEGDVLNRGDWNVELHAPGWVNAELQEYVDSEENIYIEDGNLVLKPVKSVDGNGNASYTSGRVNTQGKRDFKYGLFEARVKVPAGKGYLPAFWLMASDENLYGQWPRCGEIDIMEVMGQNTTTSHGTVHYGNPHAQSQGTYVLEEGSFSDEYHTFALEWEPGRLRWYVDGNLYHEESDWHSTTEGQGTITYPAPFDQDFYVILNLAIGGSWVGYPDETTTFEDQQYTIDYVRVYQKDSYDENVRPPEKEPVIIRDPDATGNYVVNGDFTVAEDLNDNAGWIFLTAEGGVGSAQIANGRMDITMTAAGSQNHSIQLVQPNIPIVRGGTYKLTFDASADEERTVIVDVTGLDARSWTRYMSDTKITVGPETKSYEFEFTMTEADDAEARLEFNLGNQGSAAGFHLDNVRLEKIGQVEIVEEKGILADGNHVYNGSFQEGEGRMAYWTVDPEDADVSVTNENNVRKLKIVAPEGTSGENPIVIYQEKLPLAANSSYAISYSVEGPAGNTVRMELDGNSFDAALDGTQQTVTGAFVTGDTFGNTIRFTVTQPGTYYIDDVRVDEDSLIKNGSFNAGLASYEPYVDSSASATYVVDSLSEDNAFDITINDTGDQDWKIQLKQTQVNLTQGQWYRLKLKMKSDLNRKVMVALQRDGSIHADDWTPYCQQTVDVIGEYQTYTFEFQMNPGTAPFSDPQTVLSISMGAVGGTRITQQHKICIDDISLEKIEPPAAAVEPKPVGEELIVNGNFSDGRNNWDAMAVQGDAAGSIGVVDGKAVANVTNAGTEDWHVQMIHFGIQLDQGSTYKLTFKASSTVARNITVNLMSRTYDWYGGTGAALTADEQGFTLTFTMSEATNVDAGLFISMGKTGDDTPASTITLDDFSLVKLPG